MPRYFFNLHTDNCVKLDLDGTVFPTLEAAVADAGQARIEFIRDQGIRSAKGLCRFEITDVRGRTMAAVPRGDM
jgi:hypothetical protein